MSVTRKSSGYVELSFARDQQAPRCHSPKRRLTIRYTITSHLPSRHTFRYQVQVRAHHRVRPVLTKRVDLAPGEGLSLGSTVKRPSAKRYAVIVGLPGQPEMIRLRCTTSAVRR